VTTARTRLDPARRREQLLDLGVALLAERRLEDLSVDALADGAGISRGLLYHYFSSKRDFHLAVLRRMADRLLTVTAPAPDAAPPDQLLRSLAAYVGFVSANREAYVTFVRAAAAGDEDYRRIHEEARSALTDRVFERVGSEALSGLGLDDSPAVRLMVRGWSALVEDVLLSWLEDDRGISEARLLAMLAQSLTSTGAVVSATR
jgi:AcrR family transcriptional regulator